MLPLHEFNPLNEITNVINAGAKKGTRVQEKPMNKKMVLKRTLIQIKYKAKFGAHCSLLESLCVVVHVYNKHAVNDTRLAFTPGV